MRKGITYDTGFRSAGTSTREPFDPEIVRHEMRVTGGFGVVLPQGS